MAFLPWSMPDRRSTWREPASAGPTRLGRCPQLDGIRALAVLAVIGLHAWGDGVPGGAIGVDVFLVLSGFLITTLLLEEQARCGHISVARFYGRRALRLLPPLAALVGMAWVIVTRAAVVSHGIDCTRIDYAADMRADALLAGCALATARHLGWLDVVPARALRRAGPVGLAVLASRVVSPAFPLPYLHSTA